jgi:hypothetical protein
MFLIIDPVTETRVFLHEDPRQCGYDGAVRVDVLLTTLPELANTPENATLGVPCLGVSPSDEGEFRVFASTRDCRAAGFKPLGGNFVVFQTWEKYQAAS